jgi:hypothetical protein
MNALTTTAMTHLTVAALTAVAARGIPVLADDFDRPDSAVETLLVENVPKAVEAAKPGKAVVPMNGQQNGSVAKPLSQPEEIPCDTSNRCDQVEEQLGKSLLV